MLHRYLERSPEMVDVQFPDIPYAEYALAMCAARQAKTEV